MAELGWMVTNTRDQPDTFHTVNGSANIDVTLASPNIWSKVTNWSVLPGCTTSDHRVLSFRIGGQFAPQDPRPTRYNLSRARWDDFVAAVEDGIRTTSPEPSTLEEVDILAEHLHPVISAGADNHIPLKTRFRKSVP